jgi:hypothetical protein
VDTARKLKMTRNDALYESFVREFMPTLGRTSTAQRHGRTRFAIECEVLASKQLFGQLLAKAEEVCAAVSTRMCGHILPCHHSHIGIVCPLSLAHWHHLPRPCAARAVPTPLPCAPTPMHTPCKTQELALRHLRINAATTGCVSMQQPLGAAMLSLRLAQLRTVCGHFVPQRVLPLRTFAPQPLCTSACAATAHPCAPLVGP